MGWRHMSLTLLRTTTTSLTSYPGQVNTIIAPEQIISNVTEVYFCDQGSVAVILSIGRILGYRQLIGRGLIEHKQWRLGQFTAGLMKSWEIQTTGKSRPLGNSDHWESDVSNFLWKTWLYCIWCFVKYPKQRHAIGMPDNPQRSLHLGLTPLRERSTTRMTFYHSIIPQFRMYICSHWRTFRGMLMNTELCLVQPRPARYKSSFVLLAMQDGSQL